MVRKPDPRGQARILVDALQSAGVPMTLSTALDLVARQHGHKDWNVMARHLSKKKPPKARACAQQTAKGPDIYAVEVSGWSVNDMLSQRPDLLPREALAALHRVAKNADASIGVNWDTLQSAADHYYPKQRTVVMDLRVPGEPDIRVEYLVKTGQVRKTDNQAIRGTVALRSFDELECLPEVAVDEAELLLADEAHSFRDLEDDDFGRHQLLVSCLDPSDIQGEAEQHHMPFGMLLQNSQGVLSLDSDGLFQQLAAQPAHELDDASQEAALASGAAAALTTFTLALASNGVKVWDYGVRKALEETVAQLANDLT